MSSGCRSYAVPVFFIHVISLLWQTRTLFKCVPSSWCWMRLHVRDEVGPVSVSASGPECGRARKSQPALLMERLSRSSACPLGSQPVIRQKENAGGLVASSLNAVGYKRPPLIPTSAFIPLLCDCEEGTPPHHSRPTGLRGAVGDSPAAAATATAAAVSTRTVTRLRCFQGAKWETRQEAPWTTYRRWRCTSGTRSS